MFAAGKDTNALALVIVVVDIVHIAALMKSQSEHKASLAAPEHGRARPLRYGANQKERHNYHYNISVYIDASRLAPRTASRSLQPANNALDILTILLQNSLSAFNQKRIRMPSRVSPPPAQGDELDDLFNYDAGMDDVFKDLDGTKKGSSRQESTNSRTATSNAAALGIDEEIKVAKKRQPIAKLDDAR